MSSESGDSLSKSYMESAPKVTPHEELCDGALEHYDDISIQASHHNSLIPRAIEYYKRWVPTGERKTVGTLEALTEALENGWVFDPWLNSRGGPTIIGDQPYRGEHPALSEVDPREPSVYWILVKGSPEQIAGLKPFVELPSEEEAEPEPEFKPYGLRTMFIAHGEKDASGEPKKPPADFVVMHKDHIFAKGTVYTEVPKVSAAT